MISAEMSTAQDEAPLEAFTPSMEWADESPRAEAAAVLTESFDPLEQLPFSETLQVDLALAGLPLPELSSSDLLAELAIDANPDGRRPNATGTHGDRKGQSGTGTAEYFGTIAEGNRFVYVLDMSSSMSNNGGANGPSRFDRAVSELLRSLDQLQAGQSFYVVLFSSGMRRMFDETGRPQMLEATPQNKRRLQEWLRTMGPGGGTNPRSAIQFALRMKPSAVFMLSDGAFDGFTNNSSGGVLGADSQVGQLVGRDNRDAAPIHSFAYEDPQAKANMQALASLTGGQFRYLKPMSPLEIAKAEAAAKPVAAPQPPPIPPPAPPPALAQQPSLSERQQAEAMLQRADDLRDDGKLDAATQSYRELIHQHPLTPAAATARGRIVQTLHAMRMDPRRGGRPR